MLKVIDLHKSYGKKEVLKGVDFHLKQGELKCLIGVNGAGKSTLIECITGVKPFQNGQIFIDGKDVKIKKQINEIKRTFGYMPQKFTLFADLTVYENLEYVSAVYKLKKERIEEVLSFCALDEYRNVLAERLSGGYRQLLSLACVLMHDPKLLILDEPTSAMDPIFRKRFWGLLHQLHKDGKSILLITHYMEEVKESDNLMCLSEGVIVFNGNTKNVKIDGIVDMENLLKSEAK